VVTTDKWLTAAIHESGHCAAYFRFNWPFYSVSIFEVHGEVLGSALSSLRLGHQDKLYRRQRLSGYPNVNPA
jgi:hypothetical protein